MVKVSVISGFYNRGKYLERTVESILNQSFADFELIVFDDCSSDGTAARLTSLAKKYGDDRFRYIVHEENKGFVRGLRDAIDESTGEYIAIQGSGDFSLPNRLKVQSDFLDNNPSVGAVGGWLYNIQDELGTRSLHRPQDKLFTLEDVLRDNPFTHGEVMLRRTSYDAVGGYRTAFKYAQDHDLWLRMSKIGPLAVVPEVIYHRHTLMDGVSFVPKKTIQQRSFSVAALKLARMDPADEDISYAMLKDQGPTAIVPISDPEVQSFVPKAAIRLCLFGSSEIGLSMAREYMPRSPKLLMVTMFIRVYSSRFSKPFREPVRFLVLRGKRKLREMKQKIA